MEFTILKGGPSDGQQVISTSPFVLTPVGNMVGLYHHGEYLRSLKYPDLMRAIEAVETGGSFWDVLDIYDNLVELEKK